MDKEIVLVDNKFNTIPVNINIVLYRYNYIDNLIISELKKKANITMCSVSDNENIHISSKELKKIVYNKFGKQIKQINELSIDQLDKNATSIYFLNSIFLNFTNVKLFNVNISYIRNYTRLINFKEVKQIYFSYKIEYGILDVGRFLKLDEIKYLNHFYQECGIINNNEEYVVIKASEFISLLTEWESYNSDASDEYYFILDIIYDFITDKLENDDPMLLIKNDF